METPEQEPLAAEIIEEEPVADEPIVPTDDVVEPIEEDQAAADSGGEGMGHGLPAWTTARARWSRTPREILER